MTTTSESDEDNGGRPPNRTVAGMGILAAIAVTYVLSPIPVLWLFLKAGRPDLWQQFVVIYGPLVWLANQFDIVDKFYDWQERLIL